MATSVITYPVPPYSNLPIEPQYYQPRQFFISSVTFGQTTTITTTTNMNYVIGQLVRLLFPKGYGCTQMNNAQGYVISIPAANQVVVNIDSSQNVDAFVSGTGTTQPQIAAIGDVNSGQINTGPLNQPTYIPGSFINISP